MMRYNTSNGSERRGENGASTSSSNSSPASGSGTERSSEGRRWIENRDAERDLIDGHGVEGRVFEGDVE